MWETKNHDKAKMRETTDAPIGEGDVVGNFVRRVDNDYNGVKDQSLIGEDVGDDPVEDEDAAADPSRRE